MLNYAVLSVERMIHFELICTINRLIVIRLENMHTKIGKSDTAYEMSAEYVKIARPRIKYHTGIDVECSDNPQPIKPPQASLF